MYPILYYIGYGSRRTYHRVHVTGYRDGISMDAFIRLMLITPYDLCFGNNSKHVYNGKHKYGHDAYKHSYHIVHHSDWEWVVNSTAIFDDLSKKAVGKPIDLYDYYKKIGYDYKSKKLNGKTIRKWILGELAKHGKVA